MTRIPLRVPAQFPRQKFLQRLLKPAHASIPFYVQGIPRCRPYPNRPFARSYL